MAENVLQPVEVPVPLQLFGGLVTEMSPSDLPEGVSPDCQDITFFPGGISSRTGLTKWLRFLPNNVSVTYQKTYVTPQNLIRNLFLLSDGSFWVQAAETGVVTNILTVTPGSYASSVSAFGKELIVFHDTQKGTDIPRIYDGTFIDRASQNGPALPPNVSNTSFPTVNMVAAGAPFVSVINTINAADIIHYGNPPNISFYYSAVIINFVTPLPGTITVGAVVSVAGNSQAIFNGVYYSITQIIDSNTVKCAAYFPYPPAIPTGNGGTVTIGSNSTLVRSNNHVTCVTAAPHNLQVGFRAQISGINDAPVGGGISSININNEQNPGIATVTTASAHGLLPENVIKITGVADALVGGAISTVARRAQIVTVVTTAPHNLKAGTSVKITGTVDLNFTGQFIVLNIIDAVTFTYSQIDSDATSTGGAVHMVWPVSDNAIIPNNYTVISTPTPTTFTISLFYSDGTWTGGVITFPWSGTFYVTQVIDDVTFVYLQYGPNASTNTVGTVTPTSQIAPGARGVVVLFETRQGYITAPSPPTQIITPGSQYLSISDIPIGTDNVVRRIIAFTGADGANYFYIPVGASVNGIQVSTSTVINDNVTTSILVDFADPTLFDSIAIDIPGNNLFEMGVIGPCLGVANYASRAGWFGLRNSIQNFLNLGFDAGYISSLGLGTPPGWTVINPGGILTNLGDFGYAWTIGGASGPNGGMITQPAYADVYNVPILQPNTQYSIDFKAVAQRSGGLPIGGGKLVFEFYSPTSGVLATASMQITNLITPFPVIGFFPGFFTITMDNKTPGVIPSDTVLRIYGNNITNGWAVTFDDMEFYPTINPTLRQFKWSYINLPDSVDNETSLLGAASDDTFIQAWFVYRDSLLFLTQYGLYETSDLAGYEPYNWSVRQVAHDCGAVGPFVCTSGENFSAWFSAPSSQLPVGRGLYLYTGGSVNKISQEIQPDFDQINQAAQTRTWVTNDPITRRVYVGIPTDTWTAPNLVYVMDYREMDTAGEIAGKSPIHISFTGKMVCSDLSRKWTRWNMFINRGDILNIPGIGIQFSFAGGNGIAPATGSGGFSSVYWLAPDAMQDDDFGLIVPYYTTYFFVNHEMEMNIQVGVHRKLFKRYSVYVQGFGQLVVTPYGDTLTNPWPVINNLPLSDNQLFDLGDGLSVIAERAAFKIGSIPPPFFSVPLNESLHNSFTLNKFTVTISQEPVAPVRFGAI